MHKIYIYFQNENFKLIIIFIDTLKYGYQIGFGTLVVHTLKYEYFSIYYYKLTQEYSTWGVQSQD